MKLKPVLIASAMYLGLIGLGLANIVGFGCVAGTDVWGVSSTAMRETAGGRR